jgi:hypothetical protein
VSLSANLSNGPDSLPRRRTKKPIATLQMLTGKMYAIWEPTLIAAALRNKNLSFKPQVMAYTKNLTNISEESNRILRGPKNDFPSYEPMMGHVIPQSLAGASLRRINDLALELLARELSGLEEKEMDDLWMWIRTIMTTLTAKALYGKEDPFTKNPEMEDLLWYVWAMCLPSCAYEGG